MIEMLWFETGREEVCWETCNVTLHQQWSQYLISRVGIVVHLSRQLQSPTYLQQHQGGVCNGNTYLDRCTCVVSLHMNFLHLLQKMIEIIISSCMELITKGPDNFHIGSWHLLVAPDQRVYRKAAGPRLMKDCNQGLIGGCNRLSNLDLTWYSITWDLHLCCGHCCSRK